MAKKRRTSKQKSAQRKGAKRLKRMHAEAKKIKKAHPNMQYKTALKQAAKKIKK